MCDEQWFKKNEFVRDGASLVARNLCDDKTVAKFLAAMIQPQLASCLPKSLQISMRFAKRDSNTLISRQRSVGRR